MAAVLEEPNNKRYCIKIKFILQRKIIRLFRSSNMAAVNTLIVIKGKLCLWQCEAEGDNKAVFLCFRPLINQKRKRKCSLSGITARRQCV